MRIRSILCRNSRHCSRWYWWHTVCCGQGCLTYTIEWTGSHVSLPCEMISKPPPRVSGCFHVYWGQPVPLHPSSTCSRRHGWLGTRKSIHPRVKKWVMRCWHSYLSGVRCKWFVYGPADATATPSSLASLKSFVLTFLVPAYPGCPGKEAVKWVSCSRREPLWING